MKILLLAIGLSLFGCNKTEKQLTLPPNPLKVYESNGVKVKSYNFNGLDYFLKQENDTLYVINFWATWCKPCVEELPHFEKLNRVAKNSKTKVLLVSIDFPKMVESKLLPYIKENNIQSEVVLLNDPDANSWIPKVDVSWSGAIPATIIYKNSEKRFFEKSFTYEELETEIKKFN
ncbi:redoxin domain-containing protein [Flavobacterium sp. NST-5]|uniref:Redoxin domain-containing protein n=1 Tax=Flavobacterium ichthyis TaxID=2698827 RepID=A0ABW9Z627_9FLAO|nr:TlpA disulfide reductase family protein [Flavobacterium ichthyis]NBL64134.1 redoxin domain-containing protein [Flavobacterium ichthyis]